MHPGTGDLRFMAMLWIQHGTFLLEWETPQSVTTNLIVRDNGFRGRPGSVDNGVGNPSGRPLNIVVAGNRWRNTSQPRGYSDGWVLA